MKLSIITINYNNLEGLRRTVDSVMSQIWREFEWIIVDGGSTDGSKELIEQIASSPDSNISWWCSEKDRGVYNAMNKGISHATGDFLNFMNSGDCYHDANVLSIFSKVDSSGKDVLYGMARYIFEGREEIRRYPNPLPLDFFLGGCTINHQSTFIRRDVQLRNLYSENYTICSDLRFFLMSKLEKRQFQSLDFVVADFVANGLSQQRNDIVWQENQRIYQDVLGSHFFPKEIQVLSMAYNKRRLYRRIVSLLASLFD